MRDVDALIQDFGALANLRKQTVTKNNETNMKDLTSLVENMNYKELLEFKEVVENDFRKKEILFGEAKVKDHERFIGKCYVLKETGENNEEKEHYIRVVNNNGCDTKSASVFYFEFPITYTTGLNNSIDFFGIGIASLELFAENDNGEDIVMQQYEEISEEEFFIKYDKYIYELKEKLQGDFFKGESL